MEKSDIIFYIGLVGAIIVITLFFIGAKIDIENTCFPAAKEICAEHNLTYNGWYIGTNNKIVECLSGHELKEYRFVC